MACTTGSEAEKSACLKIYAHASAYLDQIAELLKRERPGDLNDLLNPRRFRGSFQNIVVTYLPFPLWLYRFDDQITRGLAVNINSYRYQRERHLNEVDGVLAKFLGNSAGHALKQAFEDAGRELLILPYFNFGLYNIPPFKSLGLNSTAQPGFDRPKPGFKGTDPIIMFSPYLWGQDGNRGSFGYGGPGSDQDEVLFHELMHGLRYMEGVNLHEKDDDQEEFLAVILTDIYMAANEKQTLRASHNDFSPMPHPREFSRNPQNRRVLLNFKIAQPDFYQALADIPERKAWWNPVRELRDNGS